MESTNEKVRILQIWFSSQVEQIWFFCLKSDKTILLKREVYFLSKPYATEVMSDFSISKKEKIFYFHVSTVKFF